MNVLQNSSHILAYIHTHTVYTHVWPYTLHTYTHNTRTHIHYIHSVPYLLVYTEDSANPGLEVLGGTMHRMNMYTDFFLIIISQTIESTTFLYSFYIILGTNK